MKALLKSKLFDSFLYDEDEKILRLFMRNGQIRIYRQIPEFIAVGLSQAKSAGDYYFENVRNRFPSD